MPPWGFSRYFLQEEQQGKQDPLSEGLCREAGSSAPPGRVIAETLSDQWPWKMVTSQ